ncbi:hypothetical protein CLV45_2405 [Hymenobacter chitinivorans DSM 11115]|uniref:Uncharacterized protein n=1 Tax=Hymenobacter chitinivorans DSM 11115 TaxID=1121954 RepID=A0A2M9BSN8_9BACT|nr:hypothetical protein CLV45_2405 [Hymenobacter chitinivorans DSM 11115]
MRKTVAMLPLNSMLLIDNDSKTIYTASHDLKVPVSNREALLTNW